MINNGNEEDDIDESNTKKRHLLKKFMFAGKARERAAERHTHTHTISMH